MKAWQLWLIGLPVFVSIGTAYVSDGFTDEVVIPAIVGDLIGTYLFYGSIIFGVVYLIYKKVIKKKTELKSTQPI